MLTSMWCYQQQLCVLLVINWNRCAIQRLGLSLEDLQEHVDTLRLNQRTKYLVVVNQVRS